MKTKTENINTLPISNNIISIALSSIYPKDTIDRLIAVAHGTGNPYVATEMLLGIYDAPVLHKNAMDQEDKINLVFFSYDAFTDEVSYSYNRVNNKKGYCKRNSDNYYTESDLLISSSYYSSAIAKELGITSDEFDEQYIYATYHSTISDELRTDTMPSAEWQKIHVSYKYSYDANDAYNEHLLNALENETSEC
jgi:hypothetical protein